jgi:sacsin
MPPSSPREHVERIRRERYFIGRGEQNPLAEDMHQAVNYLSQDVHFLMELVHASAIPLITFCSCVANRLIRAGVFSKFCNFL